MPLVIIAEDGTGLPDANSYATMAEACAYFASRPRSTAWAPLVADQKASYLIHATRYLDASTVWEGAPVSDRQALGFPRRLEGENTGVPASIKAALCELAYLLIGGDVTADPATSGLSKIVVGPIEIDTQPNREPPVLPRFIRSLVSFYGQARGGSLVNARVVRR